MTYENLSSLANKSNILLEDFITVSPYGTKQWAKWKEENFVPVVVKAALMSYIDNEMAFYATHTNEVICFYEEAQKNGFIVSFGKVEADMQSVQNLPQTNYAERLIRFVAKMDKRR